MIRTILVPLSGAESDAAPLDAVMGLADRIGGAHIEALHVAEDPDRAALYVGEGMTPGMIESIVEAARKREAERRDRARAQFDAAIGRHAVTVAEAPGTPGGATAAFVDVTGAVDEVIATRGRLSDLIVVSTPPDRTAAALSSTLEVALLETGCPLLVVPRNLAAFSFERAAIAWNGGPEVARAVRSGLAILKAMPHVALYEVEEDRQPGPGLDDAARYLSWHGIEAARYSVRRGDDTVGGALLGAVAAGSADLLVMGAHTRSRLRRMIFGGVTTDVMADASIPAFMMH
jgi:nucleotide-binding universal stress UspA family protein